MMYIRFGMIQENQPILINPKSFYMIKKILITLSFLFLISHQVFSQAKKNIFLCSYAENNNATALCNYLHSDPMKVDQYAENAVDKILKPLGLPHNFVLVSCPNIQNAVAVTPSDGIRYIGYDNAFMKSISNSTSSWSNLSILASEIGHHLCGHTLTEVKDLPDERKKELEADEFSGFILYKLGATLQQAQAAINLVTNDGDDTFSTHPNRSKRIASIEKGYNKAKGQQPITNSNNTPIDKTPSAEYYFHKGADAVEEKNYDNAIYYLKKSIAINPNYASVYYNLGLTYGHKKDNETAIYYFNKAISIDPEDAASYGGLGIAYRVKGDDEKAIYYCKKAIVIDPKDAASYLVLGYAYGQNSETGRYYLEKAYQLNPSLRNKITGLEK